MKTIEKIKKAQGKLISDIKSEKITDPKKLKRLQSKAKKQMEFFNTCILYLESNPSVEFVEKQRADVMAKIENVEKEFNRIYELSKNKDQFIKTKPFFYKVHTVPKMKEQLKYLNYMLG